MSRDQGGARVGREERRGYEWGSGRGMSGDGREEGLNKKRLKIIHTSSAEHTSSIRKTFQTNSQTTKQTNSRKHIPGLKLFGTERVSDILYGITQTVCIIVSGVNTPLVPGMRMRGKLDTVSHGILFPVLQRHLHSKSGLTRNGRTVSDFWLVFFVGRKG